MHPELGWMVNSEDFYYVDEYGDRLPDRASGALWIPEEAHVEYYALHLVESTGLSYIEIMDMDYYDYYRLSCIARAKAWTPKTRDKREKYY